MTSKREKSPQGRSNKSKKAEEFPDRCFVCPEFKIVKKPTGPNGEMIEKKVPYGMDADTKCSNCRIQCCPVHFGICSNCIQPSCINCGRNINRKWYCSTCAADKSVKKSLPFVRNKYSCTWCSAPRVKGGGDGFCIRCGERMPSLETS
jgi:hypothetical protein